MTKPLRAVLALLPRPPAARWTPLIAAIASLILLVSWSDIALAHAYLVRSEPAANAVLTSPPTQLMLGFSEDVEPRFTEVRVLDASGKPAGTVSTPMADPKDPAVLRVSVQGLSNGVYTVAWRALSRGDGHITSGSFAFAVGSGQSVDTALSGDLAGQSGVVGASGANGPTPMGVAGKWLGYLGMSLVMGAIAFFLLVLRPAYGKRETLPSEGSQEPLASAGVGVDEGPDLFSHRRQLLNILMAGWLITAVGTLLAAWDQAAVLYDVSYRSALGLPLWSLLDDTTNGLVLLARLALLEVVVIAVVIGKKALGGVAAWWTAFGFGFLVLLTHSLASHAVSSPIPALAVLADLIHISAATTWAGGLIALVLFVPILGHVAAEKPQRMVADAVSAFSRLAMICVVAILATGPLRAAGELSSWEDLFDTQYGQAILAKIGLLAAILCLAAANRFLVQRKLRRAARSRSPAEAARPWQWLIRRTAGGEFILISAVLLATGVLTGLPPAYQAFGEGLVLRRDDGGLRSVLVVNPGVAGINSFDLYLRDHLFRPVTHADKVALIFGSQALGIGETEAVMTEREPGRYEVRGGFLSVAGAWNVELLVRLPGQEDVRMKFLLHPPPPSSRGG